MTVDWFYLGMTIAFALAYVIFKTRHLVNWWWFARPACWIGLHSPEPAVYMPPSLPVTYANLRTGCKGCGKPQARYPSAYMMRKRKLGPYREQ